MKKLFILLALGGMLYSCTKETPVTPSVDPTEKEQQDAPVDLTKGSGSENGLRVSFTAELAPFEEVAGAPDEAGEAKGASAIINPGAANNKFVDLRALADATDASGTPRVYALTYIYDNVANERVAFWTPLKISNDGKCLSYDEAIDDNFKGTANQKAIFRRMINKRMRDSYISILIGLKSVSETNPAIATYINPGAHRIDNWQQGAALPNNFVLIKSESNKLEWRIDKKGKHYEVGIQGDRRIKFRMMGYLMMIRAYNHFPEYVYKREPAGISNGHYHTSPVFDANGKQYRTLRPNLNVAIHLSEGLSPVKKLYHGFSSDGKFYFDHNGRGENGFRYDLNTETFLPGPSVHRWDGEHYTYLKAQINGSDAVASIAPKNPQPTPSKYPQVGETVVALYFPLADDQGTVTVTAAKPARFYTGNTYSQGTGGYKQNKERYFYYRGYEMTKTNKNMEGKVYYPIFNITYNEYGRSTALPMTVANHTKDFEFYKKWTSDPARNWQPEP